MVNTMQDKFVVKSETNGEFPGFHWNTESLDKLRDEYKAEAQKLPNYNGMMAKRGHVAHESQRHLVAAAAWGLFPEQASTYLNYGGDLDSEKCYTATYEVPQNDAFWSISVYGGDGYIKSNDNLINASNVKFNDDGTFTVYFGSAEKCGDVPNRVDISEGWNFLMRVYRPGESVLNGDYKLPDAVPVE